MTAPLDLDAIRARAEAATPGPWDVDADGGVSTESVPEGGQWSRPWSAPVPVVDTEVCGMGNPADAEFIAHAREDVPALLAEVERLAATVDRVRDALAGHPRCDKYAGDDPITCGWKKAVLDVQAAIEGTDS